MIQQILATTWKDLKILLKDSGGLATLFLMPVMFIFVMTLALGGLFSDGGDNPIEILVVNDDTGTVGAEIVNGLKATDGFAVETESSSVGSGFPSATGSPIPIRAAALSLSMSWFTSRGEPAFNRDKSTDSGL